MHRRDLRLCLSVGVAPVRIIFLALALFAASPAFAVDYYWSCPGSNTTTPSTWCESYATSRGYTDFTSKFTVSGPTGTCSIKPNTGPYWSTLANCSLQGNSCPSNKTYDDTTGTCNCPSGTTWNSSTSICETDNPCTAKKDQPAAFIKKFPSFDAYKPSCTGSADGCALDTCSGTSECGTDGKTGEFACWGVGKYTGQQQAVSDGTALNPPPIPEPTTTSSNQSCTAPAVNSGTTTYTCVTESNANEFASSNCAVGTVNGVQGLHCTKPDYVPEYDGKKRDDSVTEVTNPDGSKTTTTTSTTTTTHCAAGACNTTTTNTTTTSGKDANGNPTGTTTTCKGDNCDNPTTPGKDESEEEGEEEGTATPFVPGDKGDYLPEIGGGDDSPTYAESLDDFTDRVSNAPIVLGLTSIAVPSSGTCSIDSAQLFGGSVSFDDFCTMAPQVLAGLRFLFLAIWAWAAIRLFFTA